MTSRRARSISTSFVSASAIPTYLVVALLLGAGLAACAGGEQPLADQSAQAEANGAGATDSSGGGDPGLEPLTSRSSAATVDAAAADADAPSGEGSVADGTEIQAPGVVFRLPSSWQSEPPSSSMRMAQAAIPGDAGAAQLTVFYFGPGGGGGVDANIDRWVGQVALDAGTSPRRGYFDLRNGYRATWVEVEGTIQPSMMGVGPTEPQPGSRLLGAVVEGPQGPWFFKATGPGQTLDTERDAFFSMLRSLGPNG